jgi:hypothetical protein
MSEPINQSAEAKRFGEWCDVNIEIIDDGANVQSQGIAAKVDFLQRAIELWRFHECKDQNGVEFEDFVQTVMLVDGDKLRFNVPKRLGRLDSGTSAVQLQPRLLTFLLLYHREEFEIFQIIEKFIEKIRPQLTILDFKKTKTGTTRCYTNTRVAATTLRSFGFLRFTQKEAFKTWVLSLPGLLVASRVLENPSSWNERPSHDRKRYFVHPAILNAQAALSTYDQFVRQLQFVCEPNVEVFKTFDDVLRKAYTLLDEYWKILRDPDTSKDIKKTETESKLKQLALLPKVEDFYVEFSKCIRVEQLLKDVDE